MRVAAFPDVDHELGVGLSGDGRHVAHADPDVEHQRVRSGGHLAAAVDLHALARNGALLHDERGELANGSPCSLMRRSTSTPVKVGVSAHTLTEAAEIASVSDVMSFPWSG